MLHVMGKWLFCNENFVLLLIIPSQAWTRRTPMQWSLLALMSIIPICFRGAKLPVSPLSLSAQQKRARLICRTLKLSWRARKVIPIDSCIVLLSRSHVSSAGYSVRIGAFSAASNVTGILTDVKAVSRTLHRHGGLAFFDFATAAPYVKIDMNPAGQDHSA